MTKAEIFYKDIGDYLSREDKLKIVREGKSILNPDIGMNKLNPNEQGDWINKRNSMFDDFIPIEPEKKFDSKTQSFFNFFVSALVTSRDAWVYNFSDKSLKRNMKEMINFYNTQRELIDYETKDNLVENIEKNLDINPNKISWSVNLKNDLINNVIHNFNVNALRESMYRPFTKTNLFFDNKFIERPGAWSQLLPTENHKNIVICVTGKSLFSFSVLISNHITEFGFLNGRNGTTQCFPLYWYEKKELAQGGLFEPVEEQYTRHNAISDFIFEQAKNRYGSRVTKEDIFYYVYGILHSPDYRKTFANDLKKMLPRLPLVEIVADFWTFSDAGRKLADIHLNYEEQEVPKELLINGKPLPKSPFPNEHLTVNKMSFPSKEQKDTIIYNSHITISNIPERAYNYIVNGKSAIEWVMERYAVTIHKESGIKNDPNDWATEHDNPQYILNLLLSVISVSLKTVDIVATLPKVEWK